MEKRTRFSIGAAKIASLREQMTSAPTDTNWYKVLALELLSNELLPHQHAMKKFEIRRDLTTGEIRVTREQRSWINNMLRKNLGNAKVPFFILNNGIPELFDAPLRKTPPSLAELESMLEQAIHWYVSMLESILKHEDHPDMERARKLGSLEHEAWRRGRQETKRDAKQRLSQGSRLAMDRDTKKRKYEDMSAREQQILEDFDTRKSSKRYDEACVKRLPLFRGSLRQAGAQQTTTASASSSGAPVQ